MVEILNAFCWTDHFYDEHAFLGVAISDVSKSKLAANQLRMKPVDRRRMNRVLLEDAFPELIDKHDWRTPKRKVASIAVAVEQREFCTAVGRDLARC